MGSDKILNFLNPTSQVDHDETGHTKRLKTSEFSSNNSSKNSEISSKSEHKQTNKV
jgi:hypothetical protein